MIIFTNVKVKHNRLSFSDEIGYKGGSRVGVIDTTME